MIPLYIQNTTLRGGSGLPQKNPIYFIRKALGKSPSAAYDMIVLNADSQLPGDFLPAVTYAHTTIDPVNAYDVEQVAFQSMYDQQIEPNAERDGSLAGSPRRVQAVITMTGFIRGSSYADLQRKRAFLNYSFDPVVNYLEGSSTFDVTVTPSWQPFNNVGFGVLAWFDPSALNESWRLEGKEPVRPEDPFAQDEFARLNRFVFVRSVERPVVIDNKFSDMNIPFRIELFASDPTVYEFIAPAAFNGTLGAHHTVDESANGKTLVAGATSDEVFIQPTVPWHFKGPGFREVTQDTAGGGPTVFSWDWEGPATEAVAGFLDQPAGVCPNPASTGVTLRDGGAGMGYVTDDIGADTNPLPGLSEASGAAKPGINYRVSTRLRGETASTTATAWIQWLSGSYGAGGAGWSEISWAPGISVGISFGVWTDIVVDVVAPVGTTACRVWLSGNTWIDYIVMEEVGD